MTKLRPGFAGAAALLAAALAAAHPIVIYVGRADWEDDRLRVEFQLDPHQLEHETLAGAPSGAPEDVARTLAASLAVTTDRGEPLPAGSITVSAEGHVVREVSVPPRTAALALRQAPAGWALGLPRQFHLLRTRSDGSADLLRLTAGGNHAALRPSIPGEARPNHDLDPLATPLLRARFERDGAPCARLELDVPLVLLAAWPDLLELADDRMSAALLAARAPPLRAWLDKHLDAPAPVRAGRVELIAPDGRPYAEEDGTPRSIYTTRARFPLRLEPAAEVALGWSGYRSGWLRLPVVRATPAGEELVGYLNAARPRLTVTAPGSER